MNLSEQKLIGTNEIHFLDSLNASLLALKVKRLNSTIVPNTNSLIIYVDKYSDSSENAETTRKTYSFELKKPLAYVNNVSDEFIFRPKIENNDVLIEAFVKRFIDNDVLLDEPVVEYLDAFPLTLFEGENYVYTNYTNAHLELMYPKDDEFNQNYLNHVIYADYKLNHPEDFSLDDIYFKDAFTKEEDKLNLEINNLNVGCITSKNNKFSLDSEGNLVVNSITTIQESTNQNILNLVYPVGSIYLSIISANPGTLFGGTWEQLKDCFLLGAGDTYNAGSTGGEATHILEPEEMPKHSHKQKSSTSDFGQEGTSGKWTFSRASGGAPNYTSEAGGGKPHNNMPPYLTVYMWKRIA